MWSRRAFTSSASSRAKSMRSASSAGQCARRSAWQSALRPQRPAKLLQFSLQRRPILAVEMAFGAFLVFERLSNCIHVRAQCIRDSRTARPLSCFWILLAYLEQQFGRSQLAQPKLHRFGGGIARAREITLLNQLANHLPIFVALCLLGEYQILQRQRVDFFSGDFESCSALP